MQRRVGTLLQEFTSKENAKYLYDELNTGDPLITNYLRDHFMESMQRYSKKTWSEYTHSAPLPGISIDEELYLLNKSFLHYQRKQIDTHVKIEEAPVFIVTDGMPTSRRGLKHHTMKADDILETWKSNSGRGIQSREDRMSKYISNNDNLMETGVMFCDQSALGVNRHEEALLNTMYVKHLNEGHQNHTYAALGNADPANDARLLSRRIFRNSEDGVENGIPRYERRLYNRHLERDIDETLPGDSRDFKQRGFDMSDLYRKVDEKNRNYQQPPVSKIYHNRHVFDDETRYC